MSGPVEAAEAGTRVPRVGVQELEPTPRPVAGRSTRQRCPPSSTWSRSQLSGAEEWSGEGEPLTARPVAVRGRLDSGSPSLCSQRLEHRRDFQNVRWLMLLARRNLNDHGISLLRERERLS